MLAGAGVLEDAAIPGDPEGLDMVVGQLRVSAGDVDAIQSRLFNNVESGSWRGGAGDAFRSVVGELPGELEKLRSSFTVAADALHGFSQRMSEAQSRAEWLASRVLSTEEELKQAQSRRQDAETGFRAALANHQAASDPVSKSSAQTAMDQAANAGSAAAAEEDDCLVQLRNLRNSAEENAREFNVAAVYCVEGLHAASELGIKNSLGSWFDRNIVRGIPGDVVGIVAGVGSWAVTRFTKTIDDVAELAENPDWENLREVIGDVGTDAAIIGVVAGAVILGPEVLAGLGLIGAGEAAVDVVAVEVTEAATVEVTEAVVVDAVDEVVMTESIEEVVTTETSIEEVEVTVADSAMRDFLMGVVKASNAVSLTAARAKVVGDVAAGDTTDLTHDATDLGVEQAGDAAGEKAGELFGEGIPKDAAGVAVGGAGLVYDANEEAIHRDIDRTLTSMLNPQAPQPVRFCIPIPAGK